MMLRLRKNARVYCQPYDTLEAAYRSSDTFFPIQTKSHKLSVQRRNDTVLNSLWVKVDFVVRPLSALEIVDATLVKDHTLSLSAPVKTQIGYVAVVELLDQGNHYTVKRFESEYVDNNLFFEIGVDNCDGLALPFAKLPVGSIVERVHTVDSAALTLEEIDIQCVFWRQANGQPCCGVVSSNNLMFKGKNSEESKASKHVISCLRSFGKQLKTIPDALIPPANVTEAPQMIVRFERGAKFTVNGFKTRCVALQTWQPLLNLFSTQMYAEFKCEDSNTTIGVTFTKYKKAWLHNATAFEPGWQTSQPSHAVEPQYPSVTAADYSDVDLKDALKSFDTNIIGDKRMTTSKVNDALTGIENKDDVKTKFTNLRKTTPSRLTKFVNRESAARTANTLAVLYYSTLNKEGGKKTSFDANIINWAIASNDATTWSAPLWDMIGTYLNNAEYYIEDAQNETKVYQDNVLKLITLLETAEHNILSLQFRRKKDESLRGVLHNYISHLQNQGYTTKRDYHTASQEKPKTVADSNSSGDWYVWFTKHIFGEDGQTLVKDVFAQTMLNTFLVYVIQYGELAFRKYNAPHYSKPRLRSGQRLALEYMPHAAAGTAIARHLPGGSKIPKRDFVLLFLQVGPFILEYLGQQIIDKGIEARNYISDAVAVFCEKNGCDYNQIVTINADSGLLKITLGLLVCCFGIIYFYKCCCKPRISGKEPLKSRGQSQNRKKRNENGASMFSDTED